MIKTLLASSLAVGLVGCALDQPLEYGSTEGMSFEEFRASAPREASTGYYVVDWDRTIKTDQELLEFWGKLQQGALSIYNNGADIKWTDAQKRNLTYCIGAGFGANKAAVITAMNTATTGGWELFADVNFVHVPGEDANCTANNNNVMFDINQVTGQPYLARAFFPNDARANRNVLVDTSALSPQTSGYALSNILAHELGHTLGFRHEHIRPEANAGQCVEDNQFRGLTTYDSASVMHYPQCNGSGTTLAFTTRDQEGIRAIYGAPVANSAPMTQVTFPSNGATVPPSFAVEASVVDTDLTKAELFIDGASYQILTASPFTFQVTNLAVGPHTLLIVGTDGSSQTGETTVEITVAAGGGNGSGSGSGSGSGDGGGSADDITGGCAAGGSGAGLVFALGFVGLVLRRRRR